MVVCVCLCTAPKNSTRTLAESHIPTPMKPQNPMTTVINYDYEDLIPRPPKVGKIMEQILSKAPHLRSKGPGAAMCVPPACTDMEGLCASRKPKGPGRKPKGCGEKLVECRGLST